MFEARSALLYSYVITCEHVQYLGVIFMIRHLSYITLLCFSCALKLRGLGTMLASSPGHTQLFNVAR